MSSVLAGFTSQTPAALAAADFPGITLMDPRLRNGYNQSAFAGVQQYITPNLTVEVNGTMALGRRLITSDIVNRMFTSATTATSRASDSIPDVDVFWRSSQGNSDYTARTHGATRSTIRAIPWRETSSISISPPSPTPAPLREHRLPPSTTVTATAAIRTSTSGRICSWWRCGSRKGAGS
jgi:hypothetical protein